MNWVKVVLVVAAIAVLSGCTSYATKVKSVEGKAYVVQFKSGSRMLYCDATDGNPECWPVNEVERGGN